MLRHLALRAPKFLERAISSLADAELRDVFLAVQKNDYERFHELARSPALHARFSREERLTIEFLEFDFFVSLCETFVAAESAELAEREFEIGVGACRKAVERALMLEDHSCEALYTAILALGFVNREWHAGAIESGRKAADFYKVLSKADPIAFTMDQAASLVNLGILVGYAPVR